MTTFANPDGSVSVGVVPERGSKSQLNITAAQVIAGAKRAFTVTVVVAGSAVGTLNDVATTGAAAAANQFFTIPNTVGSYQVDWPIAVGLCVVPGTGQTVSISYS
jgi:hypothetical protein